MGLLRKRFEDIKAQEEVEKLKIENNKLKDELSQTETNKKVSEQRQDNSDTK